MNYNLLFLTISIAGVNWLASSKEWKILVYITKPGAILVLLAWLWQASQFQGNTKWFAIALIFSIAGDILLMIPRKQFIAGLISFLLAHTAYTIGLISSIAEFNLASFFVTILVGITALRFFKRVAASLHASAQKKMAIPIFAYIMVLGVMVTAALMTLVVPTWNTWASLITSAGALFFLISDSWVAWDRFVTPLKNRDLRIMVTYHCGQIGLILGAVLNFIVLRQ